MAHRAARVSRLEVVAFEWITSSGTPEDPQVRAQLLRQMIAPLFVHLIGLFNTVLLGALVVLHTGRMWPIAWVVADVVLTALRMALVLVCRRDIAAGRLAPLERLVEAAVVWVVVTSLGLAASIGTGDPACVVLAAAIAAVTTGTAIVRNAPVPRYACLVMLTIGIPMCVVFYVSAVPGLWFVGIQLGVGLAGMCAMAMQNHHLLVGLIRARVEITRLARRDTLTCLGNRTQLYDRLGRLLRRLADAPADPAFRISVLFLDLDRFKEINDGSGHAAGDGLLRRVAVSIAMLLDRDDFACRTGGDEFVIVMRGADQQRVEAAARRIIEAVSCPHDIGLPAPVRVGASIGIAAAPEHGLEVDELLSRADAALYQAKNAGRGVFRLCA